MQFLGHVLAERACLRRFRWPSTAVTLTSCPNIILHSQLSAAGHDVSSAAAYPLPYALLGAAGHVCSLHFAKCPAVDGWVFSMPHLIAALIWSFVHCVAQLMLPEPGCAAALRR